jgi:hydroxypyruvate isomerase
MNRDQSQQPSISRRRLLQRTAGATALGALAYAGIAKQSSADVPDRYEPKGSINHSIVQWCFADYWTLDQTCKMANQLGCKSVELVGPEAWPTLKQHGLICALAPSHLFMQGMNNPKYQPMCLELMRKAIDNCADAGFPAVITFTGFAEDTGPPAGGKHPDVSKLPKERARISPDEGIRNCVEGYKKIVGYAEQKKINLSLEMLNSRVDIEMKGHPGYQGDHVDYCMEIINQVGSPRLGLLYDIYHVQIMDGDLITRIKQCNEAINHIHTAGNPGRRELDQQQEIYYPPVMQALTEIGYKGYVGHEFIPTHDPVAGLSQAVKTCDV